MADNASGNTGLPSGVASMGGGGAMTVEAVSRLAASSSGPAIPNAKDDEVIPLDDGVGTDTPAPASTPAQDTTTLTTSTETKPAQDSTTPAEEEVTGFDLPPEPTPDPDPAPVAEQQTPAAPAVPATHSARNYADYPEELHPILKSLNNANFAAKAPVLKQMYTDAQRAKVLESELAEAKKGPQFFYEHPEGYQLDPQYRETQHQLSLCDFETEHWRNQLLAIKSGQPWVNITGYKTDAQGRLIEPIFERRDALGEGKIDTAAEVQIMGHLQNVGPVRQNILGRINGIVSEYSQSGQRAQSELGELDKRIFSKFGELDKLPADERKNYELATAAVPKYFRNHPLTDKLGKSFVMYNRLLKRTIATQQENERLKAEISGRKSATPSRIPSGGGNGKVAKADEVIKFEDL